MPPSMSDLKSMTCFEPRHVPDAEDAEVLLGREEVHDARREVGRDHHLGVVLDDELSRLQVAVAVEGDRAAERREAVRLVRAEVRLGERGAGRDAARVVVLDDYGAGLVHQVPEDVERVVGVGDVCLARVLAGLEQLGDGREVLARLEHLDVAEDEVAVDELVERGLLAGVLAVPEALVLAADRPRDLLVAERGARRAVDERYLHRGREVVRLDGPVSFFQVFHMVRIISYSPDRRSPTGRRSETRQLSIRLPWQHKI